MEDTICLFDVDGVLIEPRGYRASIQATMDYFLEPLGLSHLYPGNAVPVVFESFGVTCEWDMIPIMLAVILNEVSASSMAVPPLETLEAFMEWAALQKFSITVDLAEQVRKLAPFFTHAAHVPSEAILERLPKNEKERPLAHLSLPMLTELFGKTRNVTAAWITRVFQVFALGSEEFEKIYQTKADFQSYSYLQVKDRVLIEPDVLESLQRRQQQKKLHCAAYTARPSLPPRGIQTPLAGYSPEAEQGLALLNWHGMPLIGYGSLGYLADRMQVAADTLLKPAPVQALAGLAAAYSGEEWSSLVWAWDVLAQANGGGVMSGKEHRTAEIEQLIPQELSLHIFEDSSIGITAGHRAAELLQKEGRIVNFHAWGIASEPEKKQALLAVGARVFPDVNTALRTAFSWL